MTSQQRPDPHSVPVFSVVDPERLIPDSSTDPTLKGDREFSWLLYFLDKASGMGVRTVL
jgi:hypothetical protein